ncbi:MAG: D-2-hydroxyacid dehydrogenase, partial [Gemmatimonadales bacterium]|nr:D-2-hydroxyacid dehydrogenase [Gemmatimonadales bacterium]
AHARAGIMHRARGLDLAVRAQREREWVQSALNSPRSPLHAAPAAGEVAGASLGIIGYGGIGSALGRRAHAVGMRVQAIRRTVGPKPPELDRLDGPGHLPELLESSDFVALTAPETPETEGLLGAAELARMKPGAVLINLARGTLVDEAALVRALEGGHLRGAMLDVFRMEPLPSRHPLWGLENVLITPHVGGTSARFWQRETDLIVRNISRYQRGAPLENQVDKTRGY